MGRERGGFPRSVTQEHEPAGRGDVKRHCLRHRFHPQVSQLMEVGALKIHSTHLDWSRTSLFKPKPNADLLLRSGRQWRFQSVAWKVSRRSESQWPWSIGLFVLEKVKVSRFFLLLVMMPHLDGRQYYLSNWNEFCRAEKSMGGGGLMTG